MSTEITIFVNTSTDDDSRAATPANFLEMDIDNDYFIFTAGSDTVADGESIPSETDLNSAGTMVSESSDVEVAKCFLADIDAAIIKEIPNYADNKQYSYCVAFDGATVSEPVLEMWDDSDMDTIVLNSLGAGTPSDSWWKGVVTTDALPGESWVGYNLGGSSVNHFLWLNNGGGGIPLTVAKDLYFNLKITIPSGTESSGLEQPVTVIKYARA